MNHEQIEQVKAELERLVDRYSVGAVLDCLAEVCQDKALHLVEVWDNDAKDWIVMGNAIEALARETLL